jgi:radical SAM superfamily enzyme YgiQ (UPF0313 family)
MPLDLISLYRTRLAREKGTIKKDWGGKLTVALAYPNAYRLGMSNLGLQVVYSLLNERPEVAAERVFLPEGPELSLYLQSGKPLLALESQRPLPDFDVLAFSLSFENDYPNVLKILELGRIPLHAEERREQSPLVMAGGVTAFLNPEPLAPFFDLFLLGEAEACLGEFLDVFIELRKANTVKNQILRRLAGSLLYAYVPALYAPKYNRDGTLQAFVPLAEKVPARIRVARPDVLEDAPPVSGLLTPETEFGDKSLIETGRGCPRSCRFCAAGSVYRPPRFRREQELRRAIETTLESANRIGLLGTAVSDLPGLQNLTDKIVKHGKQFSLSSIRADRITGELLDNLKQAGQKTLAIAPESGSERLRKVINKHLTDEQIFRAARLIAAKGDFSLRLYFLIGLPTETRDDLTAIAELVKGIRHHMVKESARRGSVGRIRLSVNCFVPKPFTPFQWFPMQPVSSLKEKQKWLQKTLNREGGIKVVTDVAKWAYVQTLLSIGDRRVAKILLHAHRLNGDWNKALRFSVVNPDFFVYRPRDPDEILPWDFIDHGLHKAFLRREYELALKGEESDECRVGECFRCGVCGPDKTKSR